MDWSVDVIKFLIIGAGTIGLSYAWILSSCHETAVYVRPEKISSVEQGYSFDMEDLRDKTSKKFNYLPDFVTSITNDYDAVLVMVNRIQLMDILPLLSNCSNIVFMLNHWDIDSEVRKFLSPAQYFYGFPSQVGGGREEQSIEAVIFKDGTILGESDGTLTKRISAMEQAFKQAGLSVEVKSDILSWLKVHYLQQSLSAGAIAKAGNYHRFASNYYAVKEMVYAFREGIAVCEVCGINTKNIFPVKMFRYPAWLVAWAMQNMFKKPETIKMVTGHMKQGMPEWIAGFYEVMDDGEKLGVDMPVWKSYQQYVKMYLS